MSLKLNSSGGGSVTLQEPTTASTLTLSLPAVTGTVITTADTATVTPTMLSTGRPSWDSSGNLSFNSGYGSVAPVFGVRAWVSFNGGSGNTAGVIQGSGNVASVTVNATGQYTVTFTTAMPDTNYAVIVTPGLSGFAVLDVTSYTAVKSTASVQVGIKWSGNTGAATTYVSVIILR